MTLLELREKLQLLESQKINLHNEILQTKREIEKLTPFSKEEKIELFKSILLVGEMFSQNIGLVKMA